MQLIILPLRVLYWFVKAIWEIIEHSMKHRHRSHRRRKTYTNTPSSKVPAYKASPRRANPKPANHIPDKYANAIESTVKIARDKRRKLNSRLDAYRKALDLIDQLRQTVTQDNQHAVNILERGVLDEYRALMDRNTTTTGSVTAGPSLNIKTAKDARREGIQGAQWSALADACPLCQYLDGMQISVNHPDFDRFMPPLHDGCRCVRVYILNDEEGVEFDWETPPKSLLVHRTSEQR